VKPLAGVTVHVESRSPAAGVCATQLERLGARLTHAGTPRPDIALVDATPDGNAPDAATIIGVFESHRLDTGDHVASEATAQAVLGYCDYVADASGPRARVGTDIGTAVTGICATQAVLAQRFAGDSAAVIRVSELRTLSMLKSLLWAARSRPDEWSGTHVRSRDRAVDSGYRTADGHVTIDFSPYDQESWERFVARLGVPASTAAALRPRWYETVGWGDDVDAVRAVYEAGLARLTSAAAVELVRSSGGSSVPFLALEQCLAHPQAAAVALLEHAVDGLPWRSERVGDAIGRAPGGRAGQPLAGVRVVDLGVGGVGPFAATLLGWLGADVVKVEAPNEFIMSVRPTVAGISSTYFAINQGKRSVQLNLKQPADLALARELLAGADVLLENFRPGTLDRLGLGFADVTAINPAIVFCSATGFGWDGPLSGEPCTDPHMQAFSGFAWANADAGVPRRIRYYGFVDLVTSCVIAEAICGALVDRTRAGGATRIETSMLHAVVAAQTAVAQPAIVDELFETGDGAIAVTCRSEAEWDALCGALDLPAGADDERRRLLTARLALEPSAAWVALLARRGVTCARAIADDDALARADLWRLGVLRELTLPHAPPLVTGGAPWDLGDARAACRAPLPGADTAALRDAPDRFWDRR